MTIIKRSACLLYLVMYFRFAIDTQTHAHPQRTDIHKLAPHTTRWAATDWSITTGATIYIHTHTSYILYNMYIDHAPTRYK